MKIELTLLQNSIRSQETSIFFSSVIYDNFAEDSWPDEGVVVVLEPLIHHKLITMVNVDSSSSLPS